MRFRPILMTTMAALLGGVPLMLGTGTGSELRQPLGYAIVGGLLVSQILTLFTTPVIYLYLDRFSHWLGGFSAGTIGDANAGHQEIQLEAILAPSSSGPRCIALLSGETLPTVSR